MIVMIMHKESSSTHSYPLPYHPSAFVTQHKHILIHFCSLLMPLEATFTLLLTVPLKNLVLWNIRSHIYVYVRGIKEHKFSFSLTFSAARLCVLWKSRRVNLSVFPSNFLHSCLSKWASTIELYEMWMNALKVFTFIILLDKMFLLLFPSPTIVQ